MFESDEISLITEQWENIPFFQEQLTENDITSFWIHVKDIRDKNGKSIFSKLAQVALIAMTIPHANATPERRFSDVKNVKTDKRNCLSVETIDGIIKAREIVTEFGGIEFQPPEEMIDLFFERKYGKKGGKNSKFNRQFIRWLLIF